MQKKKKATKTRKNHNKNKPTEKPSNQQQNTTQNPQTISKPTLKINLGYYSHSLCNPFLLRNSHLHIKCALMCQGFLLSLASISRWAQAKGRAQGGHEQTPLLCATETLQASCSAAAWSPWAAPTQLVWVGALPAGCMTLDSRGECLVVKVPALFQWFYQLIAQNKYLETNWKKSNCLQVCFEYVLWISHISEIRKKVIRDI